MVTKYVVRQKVSTIAKSWLEDIYSSVSEHVAIKVYESHVKENPYAYFELVKIVTDEDCMKFTPQFLRADGVSIGDMRESFDYMKELNKERKERNLASASSEGWHLHTEYHWSRTLNGKRLDYWPSRNKFKYDGKVMCGDVLAFIRKREAV